MLIMVVLDSIGLGGLIRRPHHGYLLIGLTTGSLLIASFLYTKYIHVVPFVARPGEFQAHQVPELRAQKLRRDAERDRRLNASQAKIFALAVTQPAALRQRVVEDYEPDRRTLHQTVAMQVQIPTAVLQSGHTPLAETLYFPALLAEKGDLHDGFDVFVESGSPALVLSYREYLSFASSVLHGLLVAAYGLHINSILPIQAREAELFAIAAMMRRRQRSAAESEVDYSGAEAIEVLQAKNLAVRNLAANFVRKLTTHYAVVALVEMHRTGRFLLKYHQVLIPGVKLSDGDTRKRLTLQGWVRQALGAKPVEVAIELDNASTCQSYHLRIAGPAGMYLAAQIPTDLDGMIGRVAKGAPTPPYCRFRRRLGQSHVHFYARYFPEKLPNESPRIKFRYFETPPGSTFRAAVTAAACLALVWLAAWISVTAKDQFQGSDIPALLLAFPALAATWLGFEAPSGRLFEGTLSARFCLMATAALSLFASGLFMLRYIDGGNGWQQLPGGLSVLGVSDFIWALLIVLALVNFVHIGYKAGTATWRYAYLASRQDD